LNTGDGRANAAKTGKEEKPLVEEQPVKTNQHFPQSWSNSSPNRQSPAANTQHGILLSTGRLERLAALAGCWILNYGEVALYPRNDRRATIADTHGGA
jgi:hypothetical protein